MYIQVIEGHVDDAGAMSAAVDRWMAELSPTADGWLGSTGGVTEDGRCVLIARFESEEAARSNAAKPEQDRWWSEVAPLFVKEPTFLESTDVTARHRGDPDSAGFVQVMQGRGTDAARAKQLMAEHADEWDAFRPDVIGSTEIDLADGQWVMVSYYTSEAAAREGERKEPPPALKAMMEELQQISVGAPEFFDLTDPWISSPH